MAVCQQAAERFDQLGCHVMPIELDLPDLGPAQQTIVLCEAAVGMLPRRAEWEQTIFPPTRKMLPNADKLTYHDLVRRNGRAKSIGKSSRPLSINTTQC